MAKKKAPPPTTTTPQTTGLGSPNPAALAANVMRVLIPAGGPMTGDATQQRSETAKKARGKAR